MLAAHDQRTYHSCSNMSSHDHRYDKSASWKSRRSESSTGSPSKRTHSSSDRRYYENLSKNNVPYVKRYSFDGSRYRYERKSDTSNEKKQHADEKSEIPTAERFERNSIQRYSFDGSRFRYARKLETYGVKRQHEGEKFKVPTAERDPRNSISKPSVTKLPQEVPAEERDLRNAISKNAWSSGNSKPAVTPAPSRQPWYIEHKAPEIHTTPVSDTSAQSNFNLIFQHINAVCSQHDQTQLDRPMSFIDRIIADEAMRMLSAASSRETTSLNEPCETSEALPYRAPASEGTEASKPDEQKAASKLTDRTATVSAADSALLQKSAEQVTKKLINQLSTMNKYDLKQMIDNPAGKYETALNKHAQNKLRAEVRKQLKGFGLGKLGSACVRGDGTVESDEAIDANKIPSALLEQIGQALDLDFFDLAQTESAEPIEQMPEVLEKSQSNCDESEPKGDPDNYASMCTPASTSTRHIVPSSNVDNVSRSPSTKTPSKKVNVLKISSPTSGRVKKIIIRKPNATITNKGAVRVPVTSKLQPKAIKPLPKNNPIVSTLKNLDKGIVAPGLVNTPVAKPVVITPVQSLNNVSQIRHVTSKDTTMDKAVNTLDNPQKNVSFLRISTVEELNRRLDKNQRTKCGEIQSVSTLDPKSCSLQSGLSHKDISEQTTKMNDTCDTVSSSTNEIGNTNGIKHPAENVVYFIHNVHQSLSPVLSSVQHREQPNCSDLSGHKDNSSSGFVPFPTLLESRLPPLPPSFPLLKKGKSAKKRKLSMKNGCPPSMSNSSVSTNNIAASTPTPIQTVTNGQTNGSFPKLGKKWKHPKVICVGSSINTGNVDNVLGVPVTSTKQRITSHQSTDEAHVQDRTLINAPTPETVEHQTPITITNVCSMADTERVITPSTAVTVNVSNESTGKDNPNLQLPQESSITEPKQETTPSQHPVQSVPNFETFNCSDENLPDRNLSTETLVESKEETERIVSPQTITDKTHDEYILGGDSGNVIDLEPQAQHVANRSPTPLPTHYTARLQSLCGVTELMQSIETQTMELYGRKMQIDALFMQLHAERMDIDQQLERLQSIRREQINFMQQNLLELASANSSGESAMQAPPLVMSDPGTGSNGPGNQTAQPVQDNSTRQHERTIRRITPIGGNSVLMKIFQRRRAPSERSTDENPPVVQDQA
uniref:Uncharacterized protein n=1 Tax=Anopheles minimus TaxID=112268 RepID=A0A1Y9IW35_9DIPT